MSKKMRRARDLREIDGFKKDIRQERAEGKENVQGTIDRAEAHTKRIESGWGGRDKMRNDIARDLHDEKNPEKALRNITDDEETRQDLRERYRQVEPRERGSGDAASDAEERGKEHQTPAQKKLNGRPGRDSGLGH